MGLVRIKVVMFLLVGGGGLKSRSFVADGYEIMVLQDMLEKETLFSNLTRFRLTFCSKLIVCLGIFQAFYVLYQSV